MTPPVGTSRGGVISSNGMVVDQEILNVLEGILDAADR